MKVIGLIRGDYDARYICEVSHTEIEKFLNLYYKNMEQLAVGREIDLGRGYDHAQQITHAFRQTQELIKAHQPIITAILNGLSIERLEAASQPEQGAAP